MVSFCACALGGQFLWNLLTYLLVAGRPVQLTMYVLFRKYRLRVTSINKCSTARLLSLQSLPPMMTRLTCPASDVPSLTSPLYVLLGCSTSKTHFPSQTAKMHCYVKEIIGQTQICWCFFPTFHDVQQFYLVASCASERSIFLSNSQDYVECVLWSCCQLGWNLIEARNPIGWHSNLITTRVPLLHPERQIFPLCPTRQRFVILQQFNISLWMQNDSCVFF